MKKFYSSLMVLAALAMAFSACNKEIDVQKDEPVSGKMKTITVKTSIDTRTTLDSDHVNLIWSSGDKISIFNDQDNTNEEKAYEAGGYLNVSVPAATEEIYAHYPYFSGNVSGPGSVSIHINKAQTQKNPGELNGYNYPMVAKGTVTADNKAVISLYPVASALALNLYHTGLNGSELVKSVTVTPTVNTDYIGSQIIDITGENIKYTMADASDPITVTLTNALSLGNTKPTNSQTFDGQIYVCLAKQEYTKVKFEIQTNKGKYTITSNTNKFDCVNSDFIPVNINLAKAEFEEMEPLADGLYVISTTYAGTEYMMVANENGKFQNVARISTDTDENGKLIVDPLAAWKITYNSVAKNYTIQSFEYGTFFGDLADKTDLTLKPEKDKDVFTITEEGDGYHINSSYGRWIAYNNNTNQGDPRFAMYKDDSNFPGVVRISPAKTNAVSTITFTWEEREVSAAMESVDFPFEGKYISTLPTVSIKEGSDAIIAANGISVSEDKITVALIPNEDKIVKQAILIVSSEEVSNLPELTIIQKAKPEEEQIAPLNTILWSENWTNATTANAGSNNATPSANYGKGTTVWNGGTVTYSQSANSVYVRNENTGGGTAPELLLSKNQTWTVSGISTGSAKTLSLTWVSNNTSATISASPATVTVTGSSKNYVIKPNGADKIDIVFSASGNSRIDNVELKVTEAGGVVPVSLTGISVEDYTPSFTVSETEEYSFDGKVYAVYSDESKTEIASSGYSIDGSVDLTTAGTYTLTVSAIIDETTYSQDIEITVNSSGSGGGNKTVDVTISSYATSNNWTTGTKYSSVSVDGNITASVVGSGSNSGKYYTSNPAGWRFYQTEASTTTFRIAAASGYTIVSVNVEYNNKSDGTLLKSSSVISSGTLVNVNASSVEFTVGNTSTSTTNAQVAISKITVEYK